MLDSDHIAATASKPTLFDTHPNAPNPYRLSATDLVLAQPWLTLIVGLIPVLLFAMGLSYVVKDPSVDAFVSHDHPAYQTREKAEELFGLEDPVVVVFAQPPGETAFTAPLLTALLAFTEEVVTIEGVEPGVISLASERAILSTRRGDLETPSIVDPDNLEPARTEALYRMMPQYEGTLVSYAGDAFSVIIPVADPNRAEQQVATITALAESLAPNGVAVHLAGVATMNSRLAGHIAKDTIIFLPAAFVTIALVLLIALRRARAIIGPFVVVIGAALSAVGAIGLFGSNYFLVTTALPVVVMAIAVADSIHLTLAYQKRRGEVPAEARRDSMASAIETVALPVILTSVTTSVGFAGLAIGSPMRPIADFGLFAAVGTMVACFMSLTVLPLIQLCMADVPAAARSSERLDVGLKRLAMWSATRPSHALFVTAFFVGGALFGAAQVSFDYDRKNYFASDDPVLVADALLGTRFAGGNILDVVVDGGEDEALLTATAVREIADLERRLENMPGIETATSFADSIALMHERLIDASPGDLPSRADAPAQYMFLYEASGHPDDFDAQLDFGRQHALVRAYLETGEYSAARPIVDEVEKIVADWSETTGIHAEISGRVPVNDGWMDSLRESHPTTIGAAILFVFLTTWAFMRRFSGAATAMMPVLSGIVLLYAAMGIAGIDLAPATSMCAAIAAGLGVDFGIHLVQELRAQLARGRSLMEALGGRYVVVMRACFFSAMSLGAGFMVVALSQTPVLRWFGLLIAFAAFGSLFGALIIVPAVAGLTARKSRHHPRNPRSSIHA